MANNYFNKALKLINNKPTISEMVQSGYLAYVYPQPTIDYACKVLTGRELKLYLQICGQANGFNGAIKFYSDKANIGSNHYSQIIDSLEKKGFIKHIKYESIEVLFPTEENNINESAEPQKGNPKRIIDNSIIDSQSGKKQENKEITKMGNIEEKLGKQQSSFGNGDSQNKGYNREININKENRENPPTKEKEFEKKVLDIIQQIGRRFNIETKVNQQLKNLKSKGISNEFIFYALDNKRIEDFKMGIGLLFTNDYQEEIKAKIKQKNIQREMWEKNFEETMKNIKDKEQDFNYVRVKKVERKPLIKQLEFTNPFEEEEKEKSLHDIQNLI